MTPDARLERLERQAQFLIDRLWDLENTIANGEDPQEFWEHVALAIMPLQITLGALEPENGI